MRAERLCPATIPAEKKCTRTIAPLMTRLLNTRCISAAFVALVGLGCFLHSALPRWFPVIYGGAWGVLGLPDGRNVPPALHDLPVVLIDGRNEGGPIAVLISGNGGWWGIDDGIAKGLARAGVTTVGLNSLAYFFHRRTPGEVAATIERMVAPFRADRPVILIGYSFGADVAATAYAHLTPRLRERIRLVSLLGLSREADYAIGIMKILSGRQETIPAVAAISGPHIQCFQGADEGDRSGCSDLDPRRVEVVKVPGGHHFDGDYADIARHIVESLPDPQGGDPVHHVRSSQVAMLEP
jgi:type IV secretory pathway VirJ component